ncbi:helix-turn-helix domain-containing protein [Paraburkholderia phosphatilytica]|uniref:helix-turn-helix domain-containing protein n=1 Tax=Paraburkholderia phosphatilytica TaxID=2282883 RepID=UPI000E4DD4F0|nr:helix-turn-helix domain-containing protein [Paraburkholderia phosphatilytica]
MFSTPYFPLISALATPEPHGDRDIAERFLKAVIDGELVAAGTIASRWAQDPGTGDAAACVVQRHADLQLMSRVEVRAEDTYRRSQKMIRTSMALRVASCRNAGWQALFRNRLGSALACFSRLAEESDVAPERGAEARFAMVCVLQELGKTAQVAGALADLREHIESLDGATQAWWRELYDTLAFDLAVQAEIRSASTLQDHVFWQSSLGDGVTRADSLPQLSCDDLLAAASRVKSPLLRIRIEALKTQRAAANGDRTAFPKMLEHLNWARDEKLPDYLRTVRLEAALAALAGAAPQLAESVLDPLISQCSPQPFTGQRQIEYLYCFSKTRQHQGRVQEAWQLYSRYTLVAMQCLRDNSHLHRPLVERVAKVSSQLDDVGARLTGKYRRAYHFVLENLNRRDLSVREVAAEIGVTERALQNAFRSLLGLSPRELIRRERMERIRAELMNGAAQGDGSVLRAASRWGVENRSTLVHSYRKQFHEAPSETLERCA